MSPEEIRLHANRQFELIRNRANTSAPDFSTLEVSVQSQIFMALFEVAAQLAELNLHAKTLKQVAEINQTLGRG